MAQPLAALIVRVLADTAELTTGMRTVVASLENTEREVARVSSGFDKAAGMAGVFARTLGYIGVAALTKDLIASADALQDVAEKLGDTAEHAQLLEGAAKAGETSVGALATAIQTLEMNLSSGKAAAGLAQINLSIDELAMLSPVERYMAVAEALAQVGNQGERLRLAQELLGRGAKDLAATFRGDLVEASQSLITVSNETAEGLSAVNDAMKAGIVNAKNFGVELLGWATLVTPIRGLFAGLIEDFDATGAAWERVVERINARQLDIALPGGAAFVERPDPTQTGPGAGDLNARLAEQARFLQGQHTDIARIAVAWESVRDRVAEINVALTASLAIEAQKINHAILQNQLIAREAESRGVSTFDRMQAASGVNPGGPDPIDQIIARAQGQIDQLTGPDAVKEDAIAKIWQAANIEIAAVNQGLGHVIENTARAGEEATRLAQSFGRIAIAMQPGAYSGYVDAAGNPEPNALRAAQQANRPAGAQLPFGGDAGAARFMAGGAVTNHITMHGVVASDREAMRRLISEVMMEASTQGRKFAGAR